MLAVICHTIEDLPAWLVGDERVDCENYLAPECQKHDPCLVVAKRSDGEVRTFYQADEMTPHWFCEALTWASGETQETAAGDGHAC